MPTMFAIQKGEAITYNEYSHDADMLPTWLSASRVEHIPDKKNEPTSPA